MDDNKGTASVLMLVAFGAMWTTELQALAEIFANPPDSQTTRGRTRRARHPPPPPPPVLTQSAEGPIAPPSLSAGTLAPVAPPCLSSNLAFSRSTFRSWEPSQERSLVLLEGLITSSRKQQQ